MRQIPFDKVRAWMFDAALPFWAAHGVDAAHGGFLEEVSPLGEPTQRAVKRVRTMCRQTYVFTHAALMGWGSAGALSTLGYEYLLARARLDDGGWAKVLSREGTVIDASPDLYDLAFVLYALAWRYRLTGEAAVLALLSSTYQFIQSRLGTDEGFLSGWPDDGVRLQNPHMHMAEACLAAFESTQDERFLDGARGLVGLFRRRLFNGSNLGERFSSGWMRASEQAFEPGHHYEWAWILAQHGRLTNDNVAPDIGALVGWCERCGVEPESGAVYDAVSENGSPLKQSSRSWTNTERIKGWLGLFETTGHDPTAAIGQTLDLLFGRYFSQALPGAWVDRFDMDGRALTEAVPASILYHLVLAFSELLRLAPALTPSCGEPHGDKA